MQEFSSLTFIAIQAALQAGTILRQGFGTEYQIRSKPGRQNIVTQYDQASEDSIISFIHRQFPHHSILAEESGLAKMQDRDTILWIIDPLDGTTNFAHHIPIFTISIAAYDKNQGLCGVVFQPITHELFVAEKGRGAYLNGVPLIVSKTKAIDDAILGAGFPSYIAEDPKPIDHAAKFTQSGAILRNIGSAALSLAYVAAGKLDGFWMDNLYPWDLAAGKLLVEEAGGHITRYDGSAHCITEAATTLASNKLLYRKMLQYLN